MNIDAELKQAREQLIYHQRIVEELEKKARDIAAGRLLDERYELWFYNNEKNEVYASYGAASVQNKTWREAIRRVRRMNEKADKENDYYFIVRKD